MDDTLLFLHVLSAFLMVATVVMFSAWVLGAPVAARSLTLANVLWGIGGGGTIVFGIWLALRLDSYSITDGWILAAIVLWLLAAESGRRAEAGLKAAASTDGQPASVESSAVTMHFVRAGLVLLLLIVMIYKPGA